MRTRRTQVWLLLLPVGILLFLPLSGKAFDWHHQRVKTRPGVPLYPYGEDDPRLGVVVGASLTGEDQVILAQGGLRLVPDPLSSGQFATRPVPPAEGSLLSRDGFRAESAPRQVRMPEGIIVAEPLVVRRKRFLLNATSVVLDPVVLDQVHLAIYETGEIAASGRMLHTGGPFGNLLGGNVVLRVRAYAGNRDVQARSPSGPLVWEAKAERWLPRGRVQVLSLAQSPSPQVRRHFDEIHFMEVNLEYRKDR